MQMKMNILVNRDNLTIHDSFMVVSENEMKEVLLQVKEEHSECRVFDNRSIGNLVNEWMAYNLLFELGFMMVHTQHVDLESKPKWFLRFPYFLLGNLYRFFDRR